MSGMWKAARANDKEVVKEGVVVELHEDEPRAAARQAPERVCVRARACVL